MSTPATPNISFSQNDHGYQMYADLDLFADDLRIRIRRLIEIDESWDHKDRKSTLANWKDWKQETELSFRSGAELKSFVVKLATEMCRWGFEVVTEDSSDDDLEFVLNSCGEFLASISDDTICTGGRLADGGISQIDELACGEKWADGLTAGSH